MPCDMRVTSPTGLACDSLHLAFLRFLAVDGELFPNQVREGLPTIGPEQLVVS